MEGPARVLLHDLVEGIAPLRLLGDPWVEVRTLAHDSRRVVPGACFACIPGEQTDGHDHAAEAVAAGAVALLVERPLDLGVTQACVPSVRRVVGRLAARVHAEPSATLQCLGVTGTNGKTTTTFLLQAIAIAGGRRAGVIGTTGARVDDRVLPLDFTTPEAPDLQALLARMRDDGVTTVAIEVSSHALAQHRVDGTWFAAACFTNLSHEHLDYHGTLERYFAAKARLFEPDRCGVAVTNLDDPWGREVAARARAGGVPVLTYAIDDPLADLAATEAVCRPSGTTFVLVDRRAGEAVPVELGLVGAVNVHNALAAGATARAVGEPLDLVARGLGSVRTVPGRLERIDAGQPFTVVVDYAHTPDALGHALVAARMIARRGRVAVVFGCGGDRDPGKRPAMGMAAAAADRVFVTSDNPRSEDPATIAAAAAAGVRRGGREPTVVLDRREAIEAALAWARPGDVVLVAGKGHETGQTMGGITVPFDDRAVVRELLERVACA